MLSALKPVQRATVCSKTTVYCPSCGSKTTHRCLLVGTENNGTIYKCVGCDLRRLLPLPDLDIEPEDGHGMYSQQTKQLDLVYEQQVDKAVEGYLAKLHKMRCPVKTMLDLGGGMGYYSRAFARKGVDVTYIDRDPVSIGFAKPLNEKAGELKKANQVYKQRKNKTCFFFI